MAKKDRLIYPGTTAGDTIFNIDYPSIAGPKLLQAPISLKREIFSGSRWGTVLGMDTEDGGSIKEPRDEIITPRLWPSVRNLAAADAQFHLSPRPTILMSA